MSSANCSIIKKLKEKTYQMRTRDARACELTSCDPKLARHLDVTLESCQLTVDGFGLPLPYLEAHNFYKKLLIKGLANLVLYQNFTKLFNEWNVMVFPQAEFEMVPDSQAASTNDERSESISTSSANLKNSDITNILRMLSLETMDNTQPESEILPTSSDNDKDNLNWGLDNHDDDVYWQSQKAQNPNITPSQSAIYGTDMRPLSIDQVQVHGVISAISARSLSTTFSTTITNTLLPSPIVNTPESSTGSGPAPNIIKLTHALKRLECATHDQPQAQPEAEAVPCMDGPGPSEVCLVLVIYLRLNINPFCTLYY